MSCHIHHPATFPRPGNLLGVSLLLFASIAVSSIQAAPPTPGPVTTAFAPENYARVLHVDPATGTDITGDGSIDNPVASIVAALEEAGAPNPDQRVAILVSQGVYTQPTFVLKPHVDLYGGFSRPGGERDLAAYRTVLDGQFARRIAFGADHARIDGFHFIRGRVRGKGAALLCDGTSPTVSNCVFQDNRTLIPENWEPLLIHETAHDGGAVMILNGARPVIEHNLFYLNATECGRGGALAVDRAAAPVIRNNVFADNRAGFDDPMRSSDGGAVSFFDWSNGVFSGNVVVSNEALTKNDAGGVFLALWSAPDVVDNVFVGNISGDDAGGLFIGGQEHRYDAPLDPYPDSDAFNVRVEGNVFMGNAQSGGNSGASRITMETRATLRNNIVAHNNGGLYLQRSEIVAENNTVWQDWRVIEDKKGLGESRFSGNILKDLMGEIDARATFTGNMVPPVVPGRGNMKVEDVFVDDTVTGAIESSSFDPLTLTTTLRLTEPLPTGKDFTARPINIDRGLWRVIKTAAEHEIVIWGRPRVSTTGYKTFEIPRSFTLRDDAPKGIGATPIRN